MKEWLLNAFWKVACVTYLTFSRESRGILGMGLSWTLGRAGSLITPAPSHSIALSLAPPFLSFEFFHTLG